MEYLVLAHEKDETHEIGRGDNYKDIETKVIESFPRSLAEEIQVYVVDHQYETLHRVH